MRQIVRWGSAAAALCFVLVTGCMQSTSPITDATFANGGLPSSASEMASAALGNDLQVADSTRQGGCSGVGFPLRLPSGCPYDAGSGSFVCTDIGNDGLARTLTYQFLDGSNTPQSAYDSLATASVHVVSTIAGSVGRDGHTFSIDDRRDLAITGLEGSETSRTWNGDASSSHRDSSGTGVIWVHSTTAVANVITPAPFGRDSWPLSGTITTHLTTSNGVDQTSVLTFNGTRYATLTVNGNTSTVDLARWLRHGLGALTGGGPRGGRGPGGRGGRGHR